MFNPLVPKHWSDGQPPADNETDELAAMLDKFIAQLEAAVREQNERLERGKAKLLPGTYWQAGTGHGQTLYIHVYGVGDDAGPGHAVMVGEHEVDIFDDGVVYEMADDLQPATREEFDEALNSALLFVQRICDFERYHKEG